MRSEVKKFFAALRQRFAWPGGYDLALYLSDGERICHPCARENALRIGRSTRDNARDGWSFMIADVYWEGPDEYCCDCNCSLPSEYGDPDEKITVEEIEGR